MTKETRRSQTDKTDLKHRWAAPHVGVYLNDPGKSDLHLLCTVAFCNSTNVIFNADSSNVCWGTRLEEKKGKATDMRESTWEEAQTLHTSPLIFKRPWSNASPKCLCPRSTSALSSGWLNALYMHSTATKALLPQIAHGDRHMFLIPPWDHNHCFSPILWKQGNMCKSSLALCQRLYPRDLKIFQFLL